MFLLIWQENLESPAYAILGMEEKLKNPASEWIFNE
jgi:hypothetical protein